MENTQQRGRYTFAQVDLGKWLWAIVRDYVGPQEFGDVVCVFDAEHTPPPEVVQTLLQGADANDWREV